MVRYFSSAGVVVAAAGLSVLFGAAARHEIFEDDRRRYFVHQRAVAACHFAQAAVEHGAVGDRRREPFVVEDDLDRGVGTVLSLIHI